MLTFVVPTTDNQTLRSLLKTKFGKDISTNKSSKNNVDVLLDGAIELNNVSNNIFKLQGKYYTEWNPLKYQNNSKTNSDATADIYKFVINFIRYNANNEQSKQNQLSFADFKHCRFQVYPNNKISSRYQSKTKQIFKFVGLEQEFNELYKSQDIAQQSITLKNLDIFCKALIEQSKK